MHHHGTDGSIESPREKKSPKRLDQVSLHNEAGIFEGALDIASDEGPSSNRSG